MSHPIIEERASFLFPSCADDGTGFCFFRLTLNLCWLSGPRPLFLLVSCAQQAGMYSRSTTPKRGSGFLECSRSSFCFCCLPTSDPAAGWCQRWNLREWDTKHSHLDLNGLMGLVGHLCCDYWVIFPYFSFLQALSPTHFIPHQPYRFL